MKKQEFLLGIAIITFCVTLLTLIEPLPRHTTIDVKITKITESKVYSVTDKEGNVEVYER